MTVVLTPSHDSKLYIGYVDSLLNSMRIIPDLTPLWVGGDSLLERARNYLFKLAYESSEVTQIVWIDADEVWKPEDLKKLVEDPRDFVTGLVRQKQENGAFCVRNPKEDGTVESCGMGFCKMSRKVMERLWKKSIPYKDSNPARQVFNTIVLGGELCSEDIVACKKWNGKIYVDDTIKVGHVGEKIYI